MQQVFPEFVSTTTCQGADCSLVGGTGSSEYDLQLPFKFDAYLVAGIQGLNAVFTAAAASTTEPSILSLYRGTTTPAVTIDQFGDLSIGTSTATSTTNQEFCLNGECTTELPFFTPATSTTSASPSLASDFISAIENALTQWFADASNGITDLFAQRIHTTEICVGDSLTDPSPICLTKSQLAALLSQTASAQTSKSVSSSATQNPSADIPKSVSSATFSPSQSAASTASNATPPQIQINGDNPAIVQVGDTYNDLGATITGPQADLNLGIQTFVNGAATSPVRSTPAPPQPTPSTTSPPTKPASPPHHPHRHHRSALNRLE